MVSLAQANRTKKTRSKSLSLEVDLLGGFPQLQRRWGVQVVTLELKGHKRRGLAVGDDKVICSWNENHEEDHVTKVNPKTWYLIDIDVLFYNAQNISPALNIA